MQSISFFTALLCACPKSAALADILPDECQENFGQIQKLIFRRTSAAPLTPADAALLATWTPLLTATDDTKAVVSPFITEPVSEPGEVREYGGGNTTVGGMPIVIGSNPTTFTGSFLGLKQNVAESVKKLMCEKVGVFLVNENGQIGGLVDNQETPTEFKPIPVYSLFVGDKRFGMYEEPDKNMIQFQFAPNWSDGFNVVTPSDFDALTEL